MEKGKITISLPSVGPDRHYVEVELIDDKSGTHFLRVRIPIATWTLATIGSMGYSECEFELHAANVGRTNQNKTERVFVPGSRYSDKKEVAAKALEPYEVDGWVARAGDITNHNNIVSYAEAGATYKVVFFRFVDD